MDRHHRPGALRRAPSASSSVVRERFVAPAPGPTRSPVSSMHRVPRPPQDTVGFAVVDVETTGFASAGHDRIIEVAVVHVDRYGRVTGAWDTLVDPGRDAGPTRVGARTAIAAPTFAQIAPRLVELLSGRVLVAHNAAFDTPFLLAELSRLQYAPGVELAPLSTMQLAKKYLPGSGRELADCCDAFDIEIGDVRRASADALATARLLGALMALSADADHWNGLVDAAALRRWPSLAVVGAEWVAREVAAQPTTFLERIAVRMPDRSGPAGHREYLGLLDRALLDRRISVHGSQELVALAAALGIDRSAAARLHADYFDDLVAAAWADEVLTKGDLAEVVLIGGLLEVPGVVITDAMHPRRPVGAPEPVGGRVALQPGDRIVLTGEMRRPRMAWEERLLERGFAAWPAVTRAARLVVAADPDSRSGKVRKARDYGIPIVDEAGLEALLER